MDFCEKPSIQMWISVAFYLPVENTPYKCISNKQPPSPAGPPAPAAANLHHHDLCRAGDQCPHHWYKSIKHAPKQIKVIHLSLYFGYSCSSKTLLRGSMRLARAITFGVRFPDLDPVWGTSYQDIKYQNEVQYQIIKYQINSICHLLLPWCFL